MKISAVKSFAQLPLFDRDEFIATTDSQGRLNHGRIRTAIGEYFERLTAKVVGGSVHKTDSSCDYCPDVSADETYYEVKAAGRSGQTFIYAGRLEKDWEFAKDHQLFYFVWSHQVSTTAISTIAELKQCLARQTRGYAVCPFEFVYALCKQKPPTKLNSKYGGSDSRATYGEGYRVNLGALKDFWKPY